MRRNKSQLPSCYYEGLLERRSFKDKVGRKLWTQLCGNTLFFYNNSKDNLYFEKQDLSNFICLIDDPSHDRKLDAARFLLRLKDDEFYFTAPSLEARELWKGFILSVVKMEVPSSLNLLPGQVHMLREAVLKENERKAKTSAATQASLLVATTDTDIYLPILCEMPACFHRVSRDDAEILLEKHKAKGNLVLRPSRDGTCFAVTTRQEFNGPVFRHYKVTRIPEGGFAIAVDNPIKCTTLHDVMNCLMDNTGGVLKPLVLENTYEENIAYVEQNKESGEQNVCIAFSSPPTPKVPPKPAPRKFSLDPEKRIYVNATEDNKESGENCTCCASNRPLAPLVPPKPVPRRTDSDPEESIYLNMSDDEEDHDDTVVVPTVLPRAPVKHLPHQTSMPELHTSPDGALLPPNTRGRSGSVISEMKPRQNKSPPPIPVENNLSRSKYISLNEELKQRLQLRPILQ